jgi:hypothetical protein
MVAVSGVEIAAGLVVGVVILVLVLGSLVILGRIVVGVFRLVTSPFRRKPPTGLGAEYEAMVAKTRRKAPPPASAPASAAPHWPPPPSQRPVAERDQSAPYWPPPPPGAAVVTRDQPTPRDGTWGYRGKLSWTLSIVVSLTAAGLFGIFVQAVAGVHAGNVAFWISMGLLVVWWVWARRRNGRLPPILLASPVEKTAEFQSWKAERERDEFEAWRAVQARGGAVEEKPPPQTDAF